MARIAPFHVMSLLERAQALEHAGRAVVHLEIGEPDFPTPAPVLAGAREALDAGHTRYTPALGIPALRELISAAYAPTMRPGAGRVAVTAGGSGALLLTFGALLSAGDEVLMPDPSYPANRHFVELFEGHPRMIPVDADTGYQLTAEMVERNWGPRTVAVMLASPSNPTGTVVPAPELGRILETTNRLGGTLVVDEIYLGLTYDGDAESVLARGGDVVVINSFSKYHGMTGWRLGWMVAPEPLTADINRLAQNVFLSPGAVAQHAALRAFDTQVLEELEQRRDVFRQRRDFLVPALRELGFDVPVTPSGAFYVYAGCARFSDDSLAFSLDALESAGVAIAPGVDFGTYRAGTHVRFSYANRMENLELAMERLHGWLRGG